MKEKIQTATQQAMIEKFPREVLTRLSGTIQYYHLNEDHLLQISQKMIAEIQNRLLNRTVLAVGLTVTEAARKQMIATGTKFENGTGDLQKVITKEVEDPIADMMAANHINAGDVIELDYKDNKMQWTRIAKGKTKEALIEEAKLQYVGYSMDPPKEPVKKDAEEATVSPGPAGSGVSSSGLSEKNLKVLAEGKDYASELKTIYNKIGFEPMIRVQGTQEGGGESIESKYAEISDGVQSGKCEIRFSPSKKTYSLLLVKSYPFQLAHLDAIGVMPKVVVTEQAGKLKLDFVL